MVKFEMKESRNCESITVFNFENVFDWVYRVTGCEQEAIEASSWAELACDGDIYLHDDFTIKVIEK